MVVLSGIEITAFHHFISIFCCSKIITRTISLSSIPSNVTNKTCFQQIKHLAILTHVKTMGSVQEMDSTLNVDALNSMQEILVKKVMLNSLISETKIRAMCSVGH